MTERSAGIVEVVVDVVDPAWEDKGMDVHGIVDAAVRAALAAGTEDAGNAEIGVRLTDDADIRTLNRTWRDRDAATNVLSFPADLPGAVDLPLLGDVVLCAPLVMEEAQMQGKSADAHWAHLTIHGILHLLGHDHVDPAEAAAMEGLEIELLGRLGIGNPYD